MVALTVKAFVSLIHAAITMDAGRLLLVALQQKVDTGIRVATTGLPYNSELRGEANERSE